MLQNMRLDPCWIFTYISSISCFLRVADPVLMPPRTWLEDRELILSAEVDPSELPSTQRVEGCWYLTIDQWESLLQPFYLQWGLEECQMIRVHIFHQLPNFLGFPLVLHLCYFSCTTFFPDLFLASSSNIGQLCNSVNHLCRCMKRGDILS